MEPEYDWQDMLDYSDAEEVLGSGSAVELRCDICKSEEDVTCTWYGSILCLSCENKVEASKRGEVLESSQYAEQMYYPEDNIL